MAKPGKAKMLRNLLVMGINELLRRGAVSLEYRDEQNADDERGYIEAVIGGKKSIILWSNVGHGELRISVWWDYQHNRHPNRDKERFSGNKPLVRSQQLPALVGACASCWLERKTGKYIMGDVDKGIFDTYVRALSVETLAALPAEKPDGYSDKGKLFI